MKKKSSKTDRLVSNYKRILLQYMAGKSYVPSTQHELMDRLGINADHLPLFHSLLENLEQEKLIHCTHGKYSSATNRNAVVSGTLCLHPRGFGFVQSDDTKLYPDDIFIPKHLTQNAVDGDRVEVVINPHATSDKGPEGKIVAVVGRSRTHVAGIIAALEPNDRYKVYVPMLGESQRVIMESTETRMTVGDRIIVEVIDWGSRNSETQCRFSHYLGHISDASKDIEAAIEIFDIRADFPTAAIEQAKEFGTKVGQKEIKGREDFRLWNTVTIDPDTAKDFDDALSLTKDNKGHYHLGVHIADVSHYVQPDTPLDKEALLRCNSTYFPGKCVPMLPEELSNNLCSLRPNVNRLTFSVLMEFDPQGNMVNYRVAKSVIKSKKRFTYKEAKKVLDGALKSPYLPELELMVELCHLLKQKKKERGNIDFGLPETIVLVDAMGNPTGTEVVPYDITHQLVEEFMLKANEVVATDLTNKGKVLTYRIHEAPMEENLEEFSELAAAFGFDIPSRPSPKMLQELFEEALDTPYGPYLASSYIRKMKLAAYSSENIGHYGLSLTHYCHFTSPIRRYADLIVHRILFGQEMTREAVEHAAKLCSDQERLSAKAENNVVLLKKLRLLSKNYQEDPYREYEAIVTKVKPFGVFFEIIDIMVEGFLHISELENDYFNYVEAANLLKGRSTGMVYHAGNTITVMLKQVDLIYLQTNWALVASMQAAQPKKKKQQTKMHTVDLIPARRKHTSGHRKKTSAKIKPPVQKTKKRKK